jgi:hypothetical protein
MTRRRSCWRLRPLSSASFEWGQLLYFNSFEMLKYKT